MSFVSWLGGLDALSWGVILTLFIFLRYMYSVKTQPYMRCPRCDGCGTHGTERAWGPCRRCGGEGRLVRLGSRRPRQERPIGPPI
jgi:hypothetical protein